MRENKSLERIRPMDAAVTEQRGRPHAGGPQPRAAGNGAKLRVRGLRKTYGSFAALEGANIEIHEGEFLTLLGPSGSGKTTLLLAIAGLNEPDAGDIWIDGALATHLPPFRRDIGMVFQNYALFPHMTVFENIAFPLRMRRRPAAEIEAAVAQVLDVIRLPGVTDRFPRQLSGGQQQRVALARALVYRPSIVLMDEPLGALDRKLRGQLQAEIKRLHRELGLAMLYVTHDQEEALVLSDRICLMRDGRIAQIGTPQDLYFRPQSLFAADFLGESNLLPGRFIGLSDGYGLVELAAGPRIRGIAMGEPAPGTPVRVVVRPEAILARPEPTGGNEIRARLTDRVISGSTTKFLYRTEAGTELQVQRLTQPLPAGMPAETAFLAWDSDACVILPDG
jgi:putative spermidine/putrescine transport system ATP-binding protein